MSIAEKVKAFLGRHGDKVDQAIDKAGDLADRKTGRKYASQIDTAQEQARKAVDRMADTDRPEAPGEGPPRESPS